MRLSGISYAGQNVDKQKIEGVRKRLAEVAVMPDIKVSSMDCLHEFACEQLPD